MSNWIGVLPGTGTIGRVESAEDMLKVLIEEIKKLSSNQDLALKKEDGV